MAIGNVTRIPSCQALAIGKANKAWEMYKSILLKGQINGLVETQNKPFSLSLLLLCWSQGRYSRPLFGYLISFNQGSISSTFYVQLLRSRSPKAQNDYADLIVFFFTFGIFMRKSCT